MQNPRNLVMHQALGVLAAFAMFIAWMVPYHYAPWTSFYNELCMGIALFLMVLALVSIRETPRMTAAAWFLLGLSAIPWLQWLMGRVTFSGDAWIATLYLFGFAVAVAVGFQWQRRDESSLMLLLAGASVVAASVSSAIGLDQTLNGGAAGLWTMSGSIGSAARGNLGQPNNLATLIGLGAIGLLLLREKQLLNAASSSCLLVLLLLGAGFTQSRTALLYGPVIALGIAIFVKRNPGVVKTRLATVCAATGLQWLIAFAAPIAQRALQFSVSSAALADRGLETSRYQAWQMFFDALKDAPWLGYGWLETAEAQFAAANRFPPLGELYFQAHNLFIELVVWCGYPLGLLLSVVIAYWYFSRAMKVSSPTASPRIEVLCAMLCITVLGVHAMLELPYHYAYFLIPAGLWIGVVEHAVNSQPLGSPKWSWVAVIASAALMIALTRDYLVVEHAFNIARGEFAQRGELGAEQRTTQASLLSGMTAYSHSLRVQPKVGMSDADIAEMRSVVARYPYNFTLMNLSFALAMNGHREEAVETLLKIRSIHGVRRYEAVKAYLRALIEREQDSRVRSALAALESALPR